MDLFGLNLSKEENDQKKAERIKKKEKRKKNIKQTKKVLKVLFPNLIILENYLLKEIEIQ